MTMNMLLDLDTGVDDALGLIYLADAIRKGQVNLLAAGTIGGNAPVELTTRNTLKVLEMLGLDEVPVARGAEKPLLFPLSDAPEVHGSDGLGDTNLEPPRRRETGEHAVDQMVRLSREYAGELTILAFGPLTNLGIAFLRDPLMAQRVKRIVLMGGSLSTGNVSPVAEANIANDPEAAAIVFRSGAPITMVGLDVTHKTYLVEKDLAPIEAVGNARAKFVLQLMRHMIKAYESFGREPECVLHDQLTAGVCLDPTLVTCVNAHLDVETRGEFTRGMIVQDRRARPSILSVVDVAIDVDAPRFVDGFFNAVLRWVKEG